MKETDAIMSQPKQMKYRNVVKKCHNPPRSYESDNKGIWYIEFNQPDIKLSNSPISSLVLSK